jgi:hypothetical protein
MRKFLTTAAALLTLAAPVLADGMTFDLTEICDPGCVVEIAIEGEKMVNGPHAGVFPPRVANNPLAHMTGFEIWNHPMVMFQLMDQPGQPLFSTIEMVEKYINGQNTLRRTAGS